MESAGDWSDQRSWAPPHGAISNQVTWNEESSWDSGYDVSTRPSARFHGASTYTPFQEDVSTDEWPAEEFLLVPPSPPLKRRIPLAPTIESCTFNLDGKEPLQKTEKEAHSRAKFYEKVLTNESLIVLKLLHIRIASPRIASPSIGGRTMILVLTLQSCYRSLHRNLKDLSS